MGAEGPRAAAGAPPPARWLRELLVVEFGDREKELLRLHCPLLGEPGCSPRRLSGVALSPPVWSQVDSLHPLSCASLCVCVTFPVRPAPSARPGLRSAQPACSAHGHALLTHPVQTHCARCESQTGFPGAERTPSRAREPGKSPPAGLVCTSTASTPHRTGRPGRAPEGLGWRLSGTETPNTRRSDHSARVFCGSSHGAERLCWVFSAAL